MMRAGALLYRAKRIGLVAVRAGRDGHDDIWCIELLMTLKGLAPSALHSLRFCCGHFFVACFRNNI